MVKELNKAKKYAIPGLITLVIAVLVLAIKGIWPFGVNRIDYFDNMQQVAPLYTHLWDWMHGDASLMFDWYTGLGTNVSMSISAFSMLSPFNVILYFIPRNLILESISIMTVVKMVVMSLTMYAYVDYMYKKLCYGMKVTYAVMYAFCGYTLLYGSCFTPWMDIVALFPLLMLSYERMMKTGKKLFYIFMMALVFIINYYLSAMALVYIFIISGAHIFLRCNREERKEKVVNLGIGTVAGLGLSAFILVPVFVQLSGSQRGNAGVSLGAQYINWLRSSITFEGSMSAFQRWTNLYGLALVIAIVLIGFMKYSRDKRMRSYNCVVLVAVMIPVFVEGINIMWHFGSYNGYTLRNGFLIPFTLISMAGYYGQFMFAKKKVSLRELAIQVAACLVYVVAFIIIHNAFPVIWERSATSLVLIELIAMTVVYVCYLTKLKDKMNYKRVLILVATELFVGAYALMGQPKCYTYWPFQYGDYVSYANEIKEGFDIQPSATDRITNPDVSLNANYPLIIKRGALSSFTAALESDTQASAKRLGYSKYFLWALDSGGTVFTEALLHVTQAVNTVELDEELYKYKDSCGEFKLYDSRYTLPFAISIDKTLLSAEFTDDWVSNHNLLYGAIARNDESLVTRLNSAVSYTEKTVTMCPSEVHMVPVSGKQAVYMNIVDEDNKDNDANATKLFKSVRVYVNGKPVYVPEIGDAYAIDYSNDYNNNLLYLGCFTDETITITIEYLDEEELGTGSKTIAGIDMDKLDKLVSDAKSYECETSYTNDSLTVNVTGSKDGEVVMLPVIYTGNWTVTVNGDKAAAQSVAGLFTAVELVEGENTIVMSFDAKGRKMGLIISLIVLALVFICTGISRLGKKMLPDWIYTVVYAVYGFVYAALILVMFVVPMILWMPVRMYDLISWLYAQYSVLMLR